MDAAARINVVELTVSELSMALKRTVEDAFGHVRLRGEISGYRGPHSSGHCYFAIKDESARIDAVIWKGVFGRMRVKPEEGLEVVVTGRVTTYPGRSNYQIVVETLEPAGVGALMALLDERKKKLAKEGLFDDARKQLLPFLPTVIGVVTSPTGAVIRDILHRLTDRFARRVIVWPVRVQGETSAAEVAAAIEGFNALPADGPLPRPDLLIVARGGGSVEDLWCFNDEGLARTVAAARIPIISAVGHETDTTLIDFVSDRRAPTPTGAAEIATPVLADLRWALSDLEGRLSRAGARILEDRRTRLRAAARGLPAQPEELLALPQQRLDLAASRLGSGLHRNVAVHERQLAAVAGRLSRGLLDRAIERRGDRLAAYADRFGPAMKRRLDRDETRLAALSRALSTLDPKRPKPGFARIEDAEGAMIASAAALSPGQAVRIVFGDGAKGATIDGEGAAPRPVPAPKPAPRPKAAPAGQGDLF